MFTIQDEINEMMEFEDCRVVRVKQADCELHICTYKIGSDTWVTLFEDYDGKDNFTRVNVNEKGLAELYKTLKEIVENK